MFADIIPGRLTLLCKTVVFVIIMQNPSICHIHSLFSESDYDVSNFCSCRSIWYDLKVLITSESIGRVGVYGYEIIHGSQSLYPVLTWVILFS